MFGVQDERGRHAATMSRRETRTGSLPHGPVSWSRAQCVAVSCCNDSLSRTSSRIFETTGELISKLIPV